MSRTKRTEVEIVQLRFPCRTCGAKPGAWCLNPRSGYAISNLHTFRFTEAVKLRLLPLKKSS